MAAKLAQTCGNGASAPPPPGGKVMSGQEDKTKFEEVQQRAREARWGADGALVLGARAAGSPFWMGVSPHTHSRKFGQRQET